LDLQLLSELAFSFGHNVHRQITFSTYPFLSPNWKEKDIDRSTIVRVSSVAEEAPKE
jgi:hypothetical protein